MTTYTTEVEINRPLKEVFSKISDIDLALEWIKGLKSVEVIDGTIGVAGSRLKYVFVENGKEILFFETIITVKPERKIASDLESKQLRIRTIIDFLKLNSNITKVKIHNSVKGKSLAMKLMLPFLKKMMKKRQLTDFLKFKRLVEAE